MKSAKNRNKMSALNTTNLRSVTVTSKVWIWHIKVGLPVQTNTSTTELIRTV